MEELRSDHEKVCDSIKSIESEITRLIQKKNKLLERKASLKNAMKRLENSSTNSQEMVTHFQNSQFSWSERALEILKSDFKLTSFRSLQLQTINATLSGKDCILILPTGGGKSLCYQLPALIDESGFTLVVSPLLSLIEDQLNSLDLLSIKAATMNSNTNKLDTKLVFSSMVGAADENEEVRLIYVTPEKLAKSKTFMSKLEKAYSLKRLKRIAIDEVHCCSQWGHDFRPDYKFLGVLKRQFPGVPILGLTATATAEVLNDVEKMLNIPSCLVFRASYNRKNLFYGVIPKPNLASDAMKKLSRLIKEHYPQQSGIVYCLTQKDSEEVAGALSSYSISASCYHASLNGDARKKIHMKWIQEKIQVIVATVAFGMGIDKPNVRFVIHYSPSKSLENYYQESGRAGRDNQNSDCILLFKAGDAYRLSTMVFAEQNGLENLYSMLRYCVMSQGCRRSSVASHFNESWSASDCANHCDLCQNNSNNLNVAIVNLRGFLDQVVNIIQEQKLKAKQSRVTALKLVDTLKMAKYDGVVQPYVRNTVVDKQTLLELFLLHLVLEGFLFEDFHFTPYNTISYIVAGPNSVGDQIDIPFKVLQRPSSQSNVSGSNGAEKKLSIINPVCSKIIPGDYDLVSLKQQSSEPDISIVNVTNTEPKRKLPRVISLIDDDDLDFGDDGSLPKKKKAN